MKLIVKSGLDKYSNDELAALFPKISRGPDADGAGDTERRNALAFENISHALTMRITGGPAD